MESKTENGGDDITGDVHDGRIRHNVVVERLQQLPPMTLALERGKNEELAETPPSPPPVQLKTL